jgi:hypothetical protein
MFLAPHMVRIPAVFKSRAVVVGDNIPVSQGSGKQAMATTKK